MALGTRTLKTTRKTRFGAKALVFYMSTPRPVHIYILHIQRKSKGGRYHCTCPSFTFQCWARQRPCKHLKAIKTLTKMMHGLTALAESLRPEGGIIFQDNNSNWIFAHINKR